MDALCSVLNLQRKFTNENKNTTLKTIAYRGNVASEIKTANAEKQVLLEPLNVQPTKGILKQWAALKKFTTVEEVNLDEKSNFKTWVITIAENTAINFKNKLSNRIEHEHFVYNFIDDIDKFINGYWISDNKFAKLSDIDDMIIVKQKCLRLLDDIRNDEIAMKDLIQNNQLFVKKFSQAVKRECSVKETIKMNNKWMANFCKYKLITIVLRVSQMKNNCLKMN